MIGIPTEFPIDARPLVGGWDISASLYGLPVLVSPEGDTFGPADLLGLTEVAEMRGVARVTLQTYLTRRQPSAGAGWRKVGRSSGWAIFAADALKP